MQCVSTAHRELDINSDPHMHLEHMIKVTRTPANKVLPYSQSYMHACRASCKYVFYYHAISGLGTQFPPHDTNTLAIGGVYHAKHTCKQCMSAACQTTRMLFWGNIFDLVLTNRRTQNWATALNIRAKISASRTKKIKRKKTIKENDSFCWVFNQYI